MNDTKNITVRTKYIVMHVIKFENVMNRYKLRDRQVNKTKSYNMFEKLLFDAKMMVQY